VRVGCMPGSDVALPSAYDEDARIFSPPSGAAENLTCQLLIAGGGLSGLSAADAAMRQGLDVIVIEKGVFGKEAASGLNAGQFLTGWVRPVHTMISELTRQEQERGLPGERAQLQAQRRVRAFLRRTVEGCQRLAQLDHDYNLRASVRHGAAIAAVTDADLADLKASYEFMKMSNLSAMMPPAERRQRPFSRTLSARVFQKRCGTAEDFYAGGIIDFFGGSFRPRKLLHGLARSLSKRGVRFFQHTEAQALDFSDHQMTVFCGNGAAIRANTLFMANAYARHINGDIRERTIFTYDYVVEVELPDGADVLRSERVLSDTRDPCFYARRHGRRLYMGYEETPETSPEITRRIARRTLEEGQRIFPALRALAEHDIKNAWSGAIYYTLDDYPFVEHRHGGRVITFAAPSDHGNSLAARVGQMVGNLVAASIRAPLSAEDRRRRRRELQQLRLFEGFPKGLRLRPGMRYQEAAFADPASPPSREP
jgi:gamma-glutamylputrescine oxidase